MPHGDLDDIIEKMSERGKDEGATALCCVK
jgi:hypothetical protein